MSEYDKAPSCTNSDALPAVGRVARRRQRNLAALLEAAGAVMGEKGMDGATMAEIAERADVGAGTIYNYFKSKDELALAVLENLMHELAVQIEGHSNALADPAQVYAYGLGTVLDTAITDIRWRQLLPRSEVVSDALFRCMGPFAIRDLRNAMQAGRLPAGNAELLWRLTAHALVGISLAITSGAVAAPLRNAALGHLICMTGVGRDQAVALMHGAAAPQPD